MLEDNQQPPPEPQAPSPENPPEPAEPEAPLEEAPAAQEASPAPEDDGQDEGQESAEPAPGQGQHKRGGGWQRRIDKLEREKQQLMEMLQRGGVPQQPQQPQQQLTEQERAALEFKSLVRQEARGLMEETRAAEQQRRLQADLQKQMDEARSRHEDFDDVVNNTPMPPPHIQEAILNSTNKAGIMYSLSKTGELARISALPPLQAALEIGRWDAKLTSGAAPQAASPKRRPVAPAPIVPVSTRNASTVKRTEDMSYDEYKAWRKQGGGR